MANIKKALAIGAITIASFPNIIFAQEITPAKFKDIDIFTSSFTKTHQRMVPLLREEIVPAKETPQVRPTYMETNDNTEKALGRVYKKVNKLLSDMVDEISRSKKTMPGMWYRIK